MTFEQWWSNVAEDLDLPTSLEEAQHVLPRGESPQAAYSLGVHWEDYANHVLDRSVKIAKAKRAAERN